MGQFCFSYAQYDNNHFWKAIVANHGLTEYYIHLLMAVTGFATWESIYSWAAYMLPRGYMCSQKRQDSSRGEDTSQDVDREQED